MSRSWSGPVTACLSDRAGGPIAAPWSTAGRRDWSRERLAERLGLLLRQGSVRATCGDRLGIHPRARPGVEAAHDEAVSGRIGQGQGEALVATGVLERIEPDEPDPLDRPATRRLQDGRAGRQLVQLAADRKDLVEVRVEDGIEAPAIRAAGQPIESSSQSPDLTHLAQDQGQQDEDGEAEADDDRAESRLDEGVQVDRSILRAGRDGRTAGLGRRPESSRWPSPPDPLADPANAILRATHATRSEPLPLMAKRSRVAARPGQRRPLQRSPARPEAPARPRPEGSVTAEEEARAAELEAAILAEEEVASEARRARERVRRPAQEAAPRVNYSSVPLATRAAEEYAYVRRDIRRITIVGGSLLLVLAVLDILVNVAHVFAI